jgi:hypothetical protein
MRTPSHPISITVTIADAPRTDEWRQLWRRLLAPLPTEAPTAGTPDAERQPTSPALPSPQGGAA